MYIGTIDSYYIRTYVYWPLHVLVIDICFCFTMYIRICVHVLSNIIHVCAVPEAADL